MDEYTKPDYSSRDQIDLSTRSALRNFPGAENQSKLSGEQTNWYLITYYSLLRLYYTHRHLPYNQSV
jgi:hypothetical protein